MFLIAVTKNEISQNFQSTSVEELKKISSIITIVTDNFLSKFISEENGFSVVESPLISSRNYEEIIFSKVDYNENKNVFDIFKSIMSGRTIYYHINSKGEFFCSTHISMLKKAGVPIEENADVLPEFFVYRYIMTPQTLYKNIKQLVAGSHLHIKMLKGKCKILRVDEYNPPRPNHKKSTNVETKSNNTLSILDESIQALNPCSDKLTVLLSGGLDSSILFKLSQNNFNINHTFSTGYPFEDPGKNLEKEYALSAAEAFNVKHSYYETSNEEYLRGFIEAIESAETPLHHLQSVMFHLIFKNGISKEKNIIISGEGAEAPFGWHAHNLIYNFQNKPFYGFLLTYPLRKLLDRFLSVTSGITGTNFSLERYAEINNLPIENPKHLIWSMAAYGNKEWVQEYFKIKQDDIIKDRYQTINRFTDRSIYEILSILCLYGEDTVTQSIWSKIGEKNNKILYYPYYHKKLLDYEYSISWDLKLRNPKNILRGVARQLKIPEFIITRPKIGFGLNKKGWAEKGSIFEPLVPLASKVFDEKQIRKMQSSEPKKAMTFWNMLNYAIWKRLCINNEPIEILLEELNRAT